jgi:hypothetical protein
MAVAHRPTADRWRRETTNPLTRVTARRYDGGVFLAPSDVALDCLQGALVLVPAERAPLASSRLLGIAIPGLALVVGVLVA